MPLARTVLRARLDKGIVVIWRVIRVMAREWIRHATHLGQKRWSFGLRTPGAGREGLGDEPVRDHHPTGRDPEPSVAAPGHRAGPPQALTARHRHNLGRIPGHHVGISQRPLQRGQARRVEPPHVHTEPADLITTQPPPSRSARLRERSPVPDLPPRQALNSCHPLRSGPPRCPRRDDAAVSPLEW